MDLPKPQQLTGVSPAVYFAGGGGSFACLIINKLGVAAARAVRGL